MIVDGEKAPTYCMNLYCAEMCQSAALRNSKEREEVCDMIYTEWEIAHTDGRD